MDRDELLRILIDAKEREETHSSLITKFFLHEFDWSGYDREKVDFVRNIIDTIETQSTEHAEILEQIINSLGKGKKVDI